jgi:predicted O-methyltransferase YrrM
VTIGRYLRPGGYIRRLKRLGHEVRSHLKRLGHEVRSRGHRVTRNATGAIEAAKDTLSLRQQLPWIRAYPELGPPARSALLPFYREYVATVSTQVMAISLELAVFLSVTCDECRPARILDLGSGFSSFVFRTYMLKASPLPEVWSVDDDAHWLERTRESLVKHDLPTEQLLTWSSFQQRSPGVFDLILYDLGNMETRKRTLEHVLEYSAEGSVLILDDVQKPEYGSYARKFLKGRQHGLYSLRRYTLDDFGRYSLLVIAAR